MGAGPSLVDSVDDDGERGERVCVVGVAVEPVGFGTDVELKLCEMLP